MGFVMVISEASTWAILMLGFGGLGFAAFSVAERIGQRAAAEWWKRKLQESSTREPSSQGLRAQTSASRSPVAQTAMAHQTEITQGLRPAFGG
jgi:hypothetical protein